MAQIGRRVLFALLIASLAAGCATRPSGKAPEAPIEAQPPAAGLSPVAPEAEPEATTDAQAADEAARAKAEAEEAAKEKVAKEKAAREAAARDQAAKEAAAKEAAAKEQAAKEQAAKEQATREAAAKEAAAKEQAAREQIAKDSAAKEAAAAEAARQQREVSREPRTDYASKPAQERLGYLDSALSGFLAERLPNGAAIAIVERPIAARAAARIEIERPAGAEPSTAGLDSLALTYASMGGLEAAVRQARGRMSIELGERDALVLDCPSKDMPSLLAAAGTCLSSPGFSAEDFDRALRDAGMEERKDAGDILSRSQAEIRSWLFGADPRGLPARMGPASLRSRSRDEVMRYWKEFLAPERLTVAVSGVADARAAELALKSWIGGLQRRGAGASRAAPSPTSRSRVIPFSGLAGSILLRVEFAEPPASSPDAAAMAVCMAMLGDLVEGRSGSGLIASRASASSLSAGLVLRASVDPTSAAQASAGTSVDSLRRAIALLASGRCAPPASGGDGTARIADRLDAYESRVLVAAASRSSSTSGQATLVARDLAAGGDGTASFRFASRVRSLRPEDVERVARERLAGGASAWIALCDPAIVGAVEREFSAPSSVGGLSASVGLSKP